MGQACRLHYDGHPSTNTSRNSWKIAIPVCIGTCLIMLREPLAEWIKRVTQRRRTVGLRKRRKQKLKKVQRNKDFKSSKAL